MEPRRATALEPRRMPRQERSKATTTAILRAAAQVFARHGYAAGTTNRIAARAGVSIGSLYEYFPNKDAILVALTEEHLREASAVLAGAVAEIRPGAPVGPAAIRRLVAAMVELHATDPGLHRVLFEEAPLPRRVRRTIAELEDAMIGRVESWIRGDPRIRVPRPRLAASLIVQTVEALTHRMVLHAPEGVTADELAEEIARVVRGYLGVRERA